MSPMILAAAIAITLGTLLLLGLYYFNNKGMEQRKRDILARLDKEVSLSRVEQNQVTGGEEDSKKFKEITPLDRFLLQIPGLGGIHRLAMKAGIKQHFPQLVLAIGILSFGFLFVFENMKIMHEFWALELAIVPLSVFLGYAIVKKYLKRRIDKRIDTFVNMFPDALDMIVRSVRSGHPLTTALRMIAENMDAPVSTEFKRVVEEMAYGRSMIEALNSLRRRIPEQDVNFFVVVLTVQQETGGNLAEVMSNLSSIIRKRKQLRLKIKAITSEGRVTGWILGSLPFFMLGLIYFTTPTYLDPLFEEVTGHIILAISGGLIALGAYIVSQMIKIDI